MLDTLAIRFSKEQTRQMFDYMDGDCDGKLTYVDFINTAEEISGGCEVGPISETDTVRS